MATFPTSVLFPFSNSAGQPASPAPSPTPTPAPPPPPVTFEDTLTPVGFTIPEGPATFFISGGGAALAAAVGSASPGDTIEITDSLNYDAITIMNPIDLTIRAAAGQTPSITANSGPFDHAVDIQGTVNGLRFRGITFIGNGNSGSHNISDLGRTGIVFWSQLAGGASLDRIILEDCTFSEPAATAGDGCPGLTLFGDGVTVNDNVWVHRCSFLNTSAVTAVGGLQWGAITIGGFQNVWIQNCKIVRQDAVLASALSNMKGVVVQNANTIVEDVLCDQIGTNGNPQAFMHDGLPGIAIGFGGTTSCRNCVAYNCRIGYELRLAAGSMTIRNCVYASPTVGGGGVVMRRSNGTPYVVQDSAMSCNGTGITFSATGVTEDHNDVFNFSATGKALDATDQTVDPLYQDVANRIFTATAPSLQTGASDGGLIGVRYTVGEEIFWVNTLQGT
jgi:hypothetical protein